MLAKAKCGDSADDEVERIPLPRYGGEALVPVDRDKWVQIGSRLVPETIAAHFPGTDLGASLTMKVEVRKGIPMLTGLMLTASPDGLEIGAGDVKAIRGLRKAVTYIVAACSETPVQGGFMQTFPPTSDDIAAASRSRTVASEPPLRRNRITREMLLPIAETYRDHELGPAPLQAVAEIHDMPYHTVAKWVRHCRDEKYGLLPKTRQGRKKA